MPYLVVGILTMIPACMAIIVMPSASAHPEENLSILSLITLPGVIILAISKWFGNQLPLMVDPLLATHLEPFELSSAVVGGVFMILPVAFAITSPISGKLIKLIKYKLSFMIFGAFGMSIR